MDELTPTGELTPGEQARIAEIARLNQTTPFLLGRDWEGTLVVEIGLEDAEGWSIYEGILILEDGRIGNAGVNQPRYFDSFIEYVAA